MEAMNAPRYQCPRCGTEYFEPLESCDWCPECKPVPVQCEPEQQQEQQ